MIYYGGNKPGREHIYAIDEVSLQTVRGWIKPIKNSAKPSKISVHLNNKKIAETIADNARPDLTKKSMGECAFHMDLDKEKIPKTIESLRIIADGEVVFSTGLWMGDIRKSISPNDTMSKSNLHHYFSVGNEAASIVAKYTSAIKPVILDIPCGHGRVLRHLRGYYPKSKIYCSDIDEDGVEYCAKNFNATGAISNADFDLDFGTKFDVIWVGSLITHFSEEQSVKFLKWATDQLKPNGVVIVTSHGEHTRKSLSEKNYGLTDDSVKALLGDFETSRYSYQDYPGVDDYGISLIDEEWFTELCKGLKKIKLQDYVLRGWDAHQDVAVLKKSK